VSSIDSARLGPPEVQCSALHRLTRKKWVTSTWSTSENGQRVRIYTLTHAGEKQLVVERSKWQRLSYALAGLMLEPQTESEG